MPGRVDVPFTRYAPHRSGRAAFPHPALHMANRMSDLCVSDTFLLEIIFLVMSISVYWTSFFLGYRHMWLPSLQWHYPPSSVVWSHPTAYISFVSLLLLTRHTLLLFLKLRKYRLSPIDIQSLYYMNRSFRRRGAVWNLTLTINPHIGFPSVHRVSTPIYGISAQGSYPCNLTVYA